MRAGQVIILHQDGTIVVEHKAPEPPSPAESKLKTAEPAPATALEPEAVASDDAVATTPVAEAVPLPAPPPETPKPEAGPAPDGADAWRVTDQSGNPTNSMSPDTGDAQDADMIAGAIAELIESLNSNHTDTRMRAADGLTRVGAAAVDPLVSVLTDMQRPSHARKLAAATLARIGDPRSVDVLSYCLTNRPYKVQMEAAVALGVLARPGGVDALMLALEEAEYSGDLRAACCKSLGSIGDPTPVRQLMRVVRHDLDERVQVEAGKALDSITAQKYAIDNAGRLQWIEANHPEWLQLADETPIHEGYRGMIRLFMGGVLVAAGVSILIWKR